MWINVPGTRKEAAPCKVSLKDEAAVRTRVSVKIASALRMKRRAKRSPGEERRIGPMRTGSGSGTTNGRKIVNKTNAGRTIFSRSKNAGMGRRAKPARMTAPIRAIAAVTGVCKHAVTTREMVKAANFQRGSNRRSGDSRQTSGVRKDVMAGKKTCPAPEARIESEEWSDTIPTRTIRMIPFGASPVLSPRRHPGALDHFGLQFALGFQPVLQMSPMRPAALAPLLIRPHADFFMRNFHLAGRMGGRSRNNSGHVRPSMK